MGYNINSRLSGGASNSDTALSLGGIISSTMVEQQTVTFDNSGIVGVAVNNAWGMVEGVTYTLDYTGGNVTINDENYAGSVYHSSIDGEYIVSTSAPFGVQFTFTYAGAVEGSDTFTITSPSENLFPNITPTDSRVGVTEYRCIYIKNDGSYTANMALSLPNSGSIESFSIGFGGAVNATAVTIPDVNTAPAGVTFTSPSLVNPLTATLTSTQYIPVWIERVLSPNNLYSKSPSVFKLLVKMT